ncbi:MAG TPA: hypothetical protein VFI27_00665 [candidate division Zixibacteria bacterium]|nr:hypothetical protein [candidate division Zixibacteria bacterium]
MNKHRQTLTLIFVLLASVVLITSCQEAASNFTDRAIENMEDEVGGAADRSRQRASDQAGGEICGSNVAMVLLFVGTPALLLLRRPGLNSERKWTRRIPVLGQRKDAGDKKSNKVEDDGKH